MSITINNSETKKVNSRHDDREKKLFPNHIIIKKENKKRILFSR